MKEPVLFKDITYPASVKLGADAPGFLEWTELCNGESAAGIEIVGGENTEREVVLYQNLPADSKAATRIQVRLARHARVRLFVVQDGAEVSHLEIEGVCEGEGAEFEIRGLQNTKERQKHSIHAVVKHLGSNSRSDMKVWCVGRDQGHSIFNGMIDIKPGARNIEAYQRNKNLMLSPKATMDTFPKLFIANDEVKAAHGASVSSLELDQLTYLQSRGISREEAESMVTRGFIHQVAEDVRDRKLRAKLEEKLGLREYLEEAEGWDS